jgi:hypothetical protein
MKCDLSEFKNIELTDEGYLRGRVTFAIPGVFPYVRKNGITLEAKLPEDILSTETIQSAVGVPITDGHPKNQNNEFVIVTPENYKEFAKGSLSDPHVEIDETGRQVGTGIATIWDSALIKKVLSKKQNEVSIGFKDIEAIEPGQYNGVNYDIAQKNIRINHLACVDYGRAGDTKIHVDHKEILTMGDESKILKVKSLDGKREVVFDSKDAYDEYAAALREIDERGKKITADAEKIKADQASIDEMSSRLAALNPSTPDQKGIREGDALIKEIETLTASLEAASAKLTALEEKYGAAMEAMPEMVDQAASEKVGLIEDAKTLGVKCDGLNSVQIMREIINQYFPYKAEIKVDELDVPTIKARYEAAIEIAKIKNNRFDVSSPVFKVDQAEGKRERFMNPYKFEKEKNRGEK